MSNNGAGLGFDVDSGSSVATPIASSNIGFQLLKKHGWKEGTGLGVSEQGRLEPVEACLKNNKRGLGAEKLKKTPRPEKLDNQYPDNNKAKTPSEKKISKKMRKLQEFEKKLQEKEFERAFFREFWPDNV